MSIEIEPEPNPRRLLWKVLVWTVVVAALLWSVLFFAPSVFFFLFLPLCYYALEMHAADRIEKIEAARLRWVASTYLEKESEPALGGRPFSEEHITGTQDSSVPGHLPVGQDSNPDRRRSSSGLDS